MWKTLVCMWKSFLVCIVSGRECVNQHISLEEELPCVLLGALQSLVVQPLLVGFDFGYYRSSMKDQHAPPPTHVLVPLSWPNHHYGPIHPFSHHAPSPSVSLTSGPWRTFLLSPLVSPCLLFAMSLPTSSQRCQRPSWPSLPTTTSVHHRWPSCQQCTPPRPTIASAL